MPIDLKDNKNGVYHENGKQIFRDGRVVSSTLL